MTVDQFIEELSNLTHKTNVRGWLNTDVLIDGTTCPITSICKKLTHANYKTGNAVEAAKRIGIRKSTAQLIMNAADVRNSSMKFVHPSNYKKLCKLRNRMLKAVGLPQENV
jgi:hypothetical protein